VLPPRYTWQMQPVSIIATVLNEHQDIASLVESLLAQHPPAAEVVVVDGGSTDGTWEWLASAQSSDARLVAIRDASCNLKRSAGPISRGRNVAIAAAKSAIIACADAGCAYAPDWLANLTAPIVAGRAEYALGGTCVDANDHTVWDVAAAPFFSVKLASHEPTKSCTARSMAFTKALWQRISGFPETVFFGEDTLFDLAARARTSPAFVHNAKAMYHPHYTFRSACRQLALYSVSDGQSRVRWPRLFRNAARCLLEVLATLSLGWTLVPLFVVLALESWYAFHRDQQYLPQFGPKALVARFAFSVAVPWVVAVNHLRGLFTPMPLPNRQNT